MSDFTSMRDIPEDLSRVQDRVGEQLRRLPDWPRDGVKLDGVALASGANHVPHKLGRRISGWLLLRIRPDDGATDPAVWEYPEGDSNVKDTTKFLTLNAATASKADIWVF